MKRDELLRYNFGCQLHFVERKRIVVGTVSSAPITGGSYRTRVRVVGLCKTRQ